MFINLSNHPSTQWDAKQTDAAVRLAGEIVDLPFPAVPPEMDSEALDALVAVYFDRIMAMIRDDMTRGDKIRGDKDEDQHPRTSAVMLQGEFTFVYRLVRKLEQAGVVCVAACTARKVRETLQPDGSVVKQSVFHFVQFRRY